MGGGARLEPGLRKSTTTKRRLRLGNGFRQARTRQNTTSPLAGRARRRAGGALWRACERNGLRCRFSLPSPAQVRSLLCGAALRLPAPRTPPARRSDAPTGRAATRPTARADEPRRCLCFPYFLAIRTFPPTSFKAGRPCISELLAKFALQLGHRHSASASAPASSRLASRPAESSDILSM